MDESLCPAMQAHQLAIAEEAVATSMPHDLEE